MNELSDKNRPRKLEDIFREGMEEAEVAPSDLLWNRIERDLNIKETGYYKQRLVWYQRLAAACVVLVLCACAYIFLENRQEHIGGLIAPAGIAQSPETAAPASAPASEPAGPATLMGKDSREGNRAAVALSQLPGNPARRAVTKTTRKGSRYSPEKDHAGTADDQPGGSPTGGRTAQALALVEHTDLAGSAADESRTFAPTPSADNLMARTHQPLARWSRNVFVPDSLAPVLASPGLNRLAALEDAAPAGRSSLAAALAPAESPDGKSEKGNAGSRWRFGGKYASQYFDQNIALANQQAGLPNNTVVPSSMLPLSSAGASSYADALKEFDRETVSGFSFNTGVSAAYQLNQHLDLETGLAYTQNVATTNTSYVFNNAQIGPRYSSGFASETDGLKSAVVADGIPATAFVATMAGGNSLNQTGVTKTQYFDTHYRYRLLGIPVKVNYQTSRSKSFYFASMGMLTNLLVQANILSDSDRVPDLQYAPHAEDSPFRGWQFAAVASAGKGFGIGPGLQIRAGLEATQYLSHLTRHPDYLGGKQRKPYTIGLALSSSYTFGR